MDLDQFRELILNILNILKYILKNKKILANDIRSQFNLPKTTVYRYLNVWVEKSYLEQRINDQENKNGSHFVYYVTPELEQYFEVLLKDLKKLLFVD